MTAERLFGYGCVEQMYAAGYGISPTRSFRRSSGFRIGARWLAVALLVIAGVVALALVARGGAPQPDATVVVQPGDTLWSIAADHYPSDDVRVRVDDIERANGLQSPTIEVGQTLRLPG
ncbi:MAG TPA: LysM peptidoglycan-binding domain-containing protein [Patescibacteria group bacterium]|nr:LysM peptidoglycan-binding domain-containing protein [Patescibacteria group bacterium]